MREVWHNLTRKNGGIGFDELNLIEFTISIAKGEMEKKRKKFVEIIAMDKGTTGLHTILAFDDGSPNPDEMAYAIHMFKITDLCGEA